MIINKLKEGCDIPENERKIVGLMLEEFRNQDRDEHNGLINVSMSSTMFQNYENWAYNRNGEPKINLFEEFN